MRKNRHTNKSGGGFISTSLSCHRRHRRHRHLGTKYWQKLHQLISNTASRKSDRGLMLRFLEYVRKKIGEKIAKIE
jgi:hypothetical protein